VYAIAAVRARGRLGILVIMSSSIEQAEEVCANCGKAAVDDVKLKICTACKLVKYCSVDCQKNHRPQHKKECKKRAAEIRDDQLFTQPDESYLGECPICCLPLPLDIRKSRMQSCCSKWICLGCEYANQLREEEEGLEGRCLFCREPSPETDEEAEKMNTERVKANDPVAMTQMGLQRYHEGDYEGALQYWTKAAGLGGVIAHFDLSLLYRDGKGVEKDMKKSMYHSEEAAIRGHPGARHNLGCYEGNAGRQDKATRHFVIAAIQGHDESLETVKKGFAAGLVSKEDYEAALRGHQAAVDATKSEQREEAYANDRNQS
jgi:hypothetical protein